MSAFLQTENLSFTYDPEEQIKKYALQGLNISIDKGSFVAIIGHNGCGKSTFAKHLNAILLPSGGRVLVNQMDTREEQFLLKIRQNIGMVFQNPDNQLVATLVDEDVAFAPENLGIPSDEIAVRVKEALIDVDMLKYASHAPHKLSGGQKQRIAIAGVIAMRPECIVMDEPTAMLDPHGREEVLKVIKKLNHEKGITIVLITHHMNEAAMADRVIAMDNGKVFMDGTPQEVFSQIDALKGIGLDVPQTVELVDQLNKNLHLDLPLDRLTAEECARLIVDKVLGGAQ